LGSFPVPELFNIDFAQPEMAARAVARERRYRHRRCKVRMSENVIARHGLEPLRRAIRACELSGTGAKVMCHIGGVETVELMSQILDTLRPGDRAYALLFGCAERCPAKFNQYRPGGKAAAGGAEREEAGRSLRRGGHGVRSFDYTVARRDRAGRTARHHFVRHPRVLSGNTPGMPYLTWVMSKIPQHGVHALRAGGDDGERESRRR
jgi:dihydroorotase